jgi:hypothetical protein
MNMHVPVATVQLGGRIADYPWSPRARGARLLLIGLLGGLGLLLIALGSQARPQVVPISIGLGALLLPIALGTAYISFRRGAHPPQLTLYEQGMVVQRGRQTHLVRYEEIDLLWEQIMWQAGRGHSMLPERTHVYTLQTRGGKTLRLSDQFVDIRQAGAFLQQGVLRHNLTAAVVAYRAGEALSFGPLTISWTGLVYEKVAVRWAEIRRMSVTAGPYRDTAAWTYKMQVTQIGQRRPWLEIDLQQIPNNRLLFALLKESGVTLDLGPLPSLE